MREIFFAQNLSRLLSVQGIRGSEMADKLKVSGTTVSAWTSGRAYPRVDMLLQIVEILQVSLDTLFYVDLSSGYPLTVGAEAQRDYLELQQRVKALEEKLENNTTNSDKE